MTAAQVWEGEFLKRRFGVRLHGGERLRDLLGIALRHNPRRAHLLVSTVLGKHIPTDPLVVHEHGLELGRRVEEHTDGPVALVIGYAETATALGHCVAEALGASYLHSTRRAVAGVAPAGGFDEPHSHATGHLLLPEDPGLLRRPGTVVLVDDELSTGRTALNTIASLQRLAPRERYVIASLVDMRGDDDRARFAAEAAALHTRIDAVCLASGSVSWPAGFPERAQRFVAGQLATAPGDSTAGDSTAGNSAAGHVAVPVTAIRDAWPPSVREGGRHGFDAADTAAARDAARTVAHAVGTRLTGARVLVLGCEELMYAPLLVACELARAQPARDVRFSSTTRSPVLALDEPGYPIRSRLRFPAHEAGTDPAEVRFAYNVAPPAGGERFSDIVLVVDGDADTPALHEPGGLAAQLAAVCDCIQLVTIPAYRPVPALPPPLRGPQFGSYPADEVGWLLTDLSDVALEAPVEEREEAIQSGGAHYAESLPIEYQPSAEYQRLFTAALEESAARLAREVGIVTELLLAERGERVVLASLARAGTPVGILMRRWAAFAHGLQLPHYAVSIVRGRGIDRLALRWLAAHHDPADVAFVDGWTGKGAITRELAQAVAEANAELGTAFDPDLTVLADTGGCVRRFGTRADYLIASACLNSTVSGLVSRTVLNDAFIGPGRFHGAKFYAGLHDADVSGRFLDTVSAHFATVADEVAAAWPQVRASDRTPTWAGWADVERVSERYGIGDVNLVKPGVGETTRVLLRRVPWRVLVRPQAAPELAHVLLLAEARGVPVEQVDDLAYSCVGLIHPGYRATGDAT